jgi:hypothetical protein
MTPYVQHERRMASMDRVVAYWQEAAPERLPGLRSELSGWGEPFCFRCGWLAPLRDPYVGTDDWRVVGGWLERAHLMDHAAGGSGEPDNLVPLCYLCHRQMPEHDDADSALGWVAAGEPCCMFWQVFTDHTFGSENYTEHRPDARWLVAKRLELSEKVAAEMTRATVGLDVS